VNAWDLYETTLSLWRIIASHVCSTCVWDLDSICEALNAWDPSRLSRVVPITLWLLV
jgi:hypothetical protein